MTTPERKSISSLLLAIMLVPTQGAFVRAFANSPPSIYTIDHHDACVFDGSSIVGSGNYVSDRALTYDSTPRDRLNSYSVYLKDEDGRRLTDQGIDHTINVEIGYQCENNVCTPISFDWTDPGVTVYSDFANSVESGSISVRGAEAVPEPYAPMGQDWGTSPSVFGNVTGSPNAAEESAAAMELQSAQSEYSSAEGTLSSARGRLQRANSALSQAQSRLNVANGRIQTANQNLTLAVGELDSLNSQLTMSVGQLRGLESDRASATNDRNEAASEANRAADDARQWAQAASNSQQELQRLQGQQASLSAQKAQLTDTLAGLEQEFQKHLANSDGLLKSLRDDTPTLTTQRQNANTAVDTRIANHNDLFANINGQTKIQEGIKSITISVSAIGQLPTVNAIDEFHFNTPIGTPEWQALADATRYVVAARAFVGANSNYAVVHRTAILDIAKSALNVADESYAARDGRIGDSLVNAALGAVDLVYTRVLDNLTISKGASFIMGMLEGATGGIANATPWTGHEDVYNVGKALGSIAGFVGDAALLAGGFATATGGTALGLAGAPVTLGGSVVVSAGAAAAGSAMASAGVTGVVVHNNAFSDALKQLTSPDPPGKFTSGNFRENLKNLTGENPVGGQAHHMFPQKFEREFRALGIEVHDPKYGAWWKTLDHLSNAYEYNKRWEAFLETSPTIEQCLAFAKKLGAEYKLTLQF
jgi:predicted  nucleic acid-binding Zn-ribbon protein